MQGGQAICASCGATGNPLGTPPPIHLRALMRDTIEAARKTQGPVLLVCARTVSRAYLLRVLRESHRATDQDIGLITFAIPDSLPKGQSYKAVFLDQDVKDPKVVEFLETCLERPPGPSIWERIRNPTV